MCAGAWETERRAANHPASLTAREAGLAKVREFKVDFFCATYKNQKRHPIVDPVFDTLNDKACTPALPLEEGAEELFQVRHVVRVGPGRIVKAQFGRNRYGEKLTQGDHAGAEEDVELRPGFALVEKNHFLYVPNGNLFVWQRHPSGSHHSKLQQYINKVTGGSVMLEPILQPDSYRRLIEGGALKSFELSLTPPADSELYRDVMSKQAMRLVHECGAISANIKLSVGRRAARMPGWIKEALHDWARSGLAKVARAKIDDVESPIDLVASRLVHSATVPVGADGKVSSDAIYSALDAARTDKRAELGRYFAD